MSETFKKRYVRYIIFALIPVVLFITAYFFKDAGGPYYLNYYDPGYVYLVNSINMMEFEDIGHTDHPGTTLQIFGAVILKIILAGKTDAQILDIVFSDPEYYLNILNKSLILINCIALFCLGIFVYSKTSNLIMSLLLQLTPFISFEIFYGLVIVSPENFLILSVLSLSAVLFYKVYDADSGKHNFALSILFAVICGFGSVSKLNFVPLCILPFILLKGIKYKLIFSAGTILVFFIFFLPVISKFTKFFSWAGNLTVNSGIHGKTDLSKFDLTLFFNNIIHILSNDVFLAVIYFLIIAVLILSLKIKNENSSEQDVRKSIKERRVLFAILLAITFQILVVAKNYMPYAQYYIVPSLMLAVTGLIFLISLSLRTFKSLANIESKKVFMTAFLMVSLFSVFEINKSFTEASQFRDESLKINRIIEDYSGSETVIPSVGTANEDCALALCVMFDYSGKRSSVYKSVFSKKSSSVVFHDYWKNKLFTLSDNVDIREYISGKKKIIFQLMSVTTIEMIIQLLKEDYNIDVKDWKLILKNENQESVYEVYL